MIRLNLDEQLKKNDISKGRFAEALGMSLVNLSRKISGSVGTSLDEINTMCKILKCEPNDIILYKDSEKKIIPIFMNYNGIGDKLEKGGDKYLKYFFELVRKLENITNCRVKVIMFSCMNLEECIDKFIVYEKKAEEFGLNNLFSCFIAEYFGYKIEKINTEPKVSRDNVGIVLLNPLSEEILSRRGEVEEICSKYHASVNYKTYTYLNVLFDEEGCTEDNINDFSCEVMKIFNNTNVEVFPWFDEYSHDCDIKDGTHTEANAIRYIIEQLEKEFDINNAVLFISSIDNDLYNDVLNKFTELNINLILIKDDSEFSINKSLEKIIKEI